MMIILIGSMKGCAEDSEGIPRVCQRMCDKLVMPTAEFDDKSIILARGIKDLAGMVEKEVQRVSYKEDDLEKDEVEGTIYQCHLFNTLPVVISHFQLPYMPSTAHSEQPIKILLVILCSSNLLIEHEDSYIL